MEVEFSDVGYSLHESEINSGTVLTRRDSNESVKSVHVELRLWFANLRDYHLCLMFFLYSKRTCCTLLRFFVLLTWSFRYKIIMYPFLICCILYSIIGLLQIRNLILSLLVRAINNKLMCAVCIPIDLVSSYIWVINFKGDRK